jgi:hypothetical protein
MIRVWKRRSLVPLLHGTPVALRDDIFVEFFGLGNLSATKLTCRHGNPILLGTARIAMSSTT